ncbi:alpha/beta fold hydrolase, partial [Saccharomonospora saliphila]|uniref:alpha/beta fold hydrolase n=1 Tax=Saccharomonospora saliphila TaxID=369829 RepID=UPI000360AB6F
MTADSHAPTEGIWGPGLAWLRAGAGPPLLSLPGLSARHGPPTGFDRRFALRTMRPYTGRRDVWWVQRRTGLPERTTMAGIADDYAGLVRERADGPVDVLGFSTGGTVALQLAADHPDVVRTLVVVSAAYRLGPLGRTAQRAAAEALRAH